MLPVPSVPSSSKSVPAEGHTVTVQFPTRIGDAHASRPGNGTEREPEPGEYDPESPFIPELQHRAPRLAAAWEAMRETLRDGERHTWEEAISAGESTGITPTTAAKILRLAVKYGYCGSTYMKYGRKSKNGRYDRRKVWLA